LTTRRRDHNIDRQGHGILTGQPPGADGTPQEPELQPEAGAATRRWLRLLLFTVLVIVALAIVLGLDVQRQLDVQSLREHRAALVDWVDQWPWVAPVVFVGVYALTILFVPPSSGFLTLLAGFLFGGVVGTAVSVTGATTGATLVFLISRFLAGDWLRRRFAPTVRRMQSELHNHAFSYILVLRLVPLLPFWLVNMAPAFVHVPFRIFIVATFLGIIPVTSVFAMFGAGLGDLLDRNERIALRDALHPQIVVGLVGLALLTLLTMFYRRWRTRLRDAAENQGNGG
jgi:uncharacterized membrane protein YdjX (TVP38/TMEM64 family)